MSPTVLELAEEYFPQHVVPTSHNTYQLTGPKFDSVVIFDDTNTYFRFSNRKVGGPREFLRYIVGLSPEEVDDVCGDDIVFHTSVLKRYKMQKALNHDTGLCLQDVVGEPGYNSYIESRGVSRETARAYGLECDGDNVIIPLSDADGKRIGSLVRNSRAKRKGDRYRTHMVGAYEKPCAWPITSLIRRRSVVVLVEGAWSVMRIEQVVGEEYGVTPIATLGTWLSDELEAYLTSAKVVAILDDDAGGEAIKRQLLGWKERGMKVETYISQSAGKSVYVDDISDHQMTQLFNGISNHSRFFRCKRFGTTHHQETRLSATS